MCLGVPGCVLSVRGKVAVVDFWGTKRNVRLDSIGQPIAPGDYILDHRGSAVRKIEMDAVAETLCMYEIILSEAGCDPIATEVVAELERADEIDVEAQELVLA
jgi:hydrogenase expression/formation protein HypC